MARVSSTVFAVFVAAVFTRTIVTADQQQVAGQTTAASATNGFDVLNATNVHEQSVGITFVPGRCAADRAYKLNERAILTVQTSQIFPQLEEFPVDFSISTDIKTEPGADTNTVFLVYDEAGDEQLGLTVGTDIVLQYADREAPEELKYKVKFNVGVDDGRWHKLLFSVKGNSVTMILDCDKQITKEIKRNRTISKSGLLMIGQQLDETLYLGDIQELKFYPTPDTAYELCLVSTVDGCNDEGKNKFKAVTSVASEEEVSETEDDFESFTTKSDNISLDLTSVVCN